MVATRAMPDAMAAVLPVVMGVHLLAHVCVTGSWDIVIYAGRRMQACRQAHHTVLVNVLLGLKCATCSSELDVRNSSGGDQVGLDTLDLVKALHFILHAHVTMPTSGIARIGDIQLISIQATTVRN